MKSFSCCAVLAMALVGVIAAPSGTALTESVAQANDNLGLALLHRLELEELLSKKMVADNVFISPFSISTVLAMLLPGSASATHAQIQNTLGLEPSEHRTEIDILVGYQSLYHGLREKQPSSEKQRNVLELANTLALQKDLHVLPSFTHSLSSHFDAEVMSEDFAHQAHQATEHLNKWASDKTHGKIAKLFPQDLNPATALVLLNAVYFKGAWKYPFPANMTKSGTFTTAHSQSQTNQAHMMQLQHRLNYSHFEDGQMVELPYVDDSLAAYVFLPDASVQRSNPLHTITGLLAKSATRGADGLTSRLAALRSHTVHLQMPRFKVEQRYGLTGPLTQLGMTDAFQHGKADLSRIDGKQGNLFVSEVIHATAVEVNEEGAEAAAVTGVVVEATSAQMPVHLTIDRPFLFLIRDKVRHLTLFAGVINHV